MQQNPQLRQDIGETLAHLRTLRDEVRVRIHLAGMEAKESWKTFEKDLDKAEKMAEQVTESTQEALYRLANGVRAFCAALHADSSSNGEKKNQEDDKGCCG